ncbi:hypothetical protein V1272_003952 [Bradyrhizobium sp. AZCC 1708]
MTDSLTKRDKPDRSKINMSEHHEVLDKAPESLEGRTTENRRQSRKFSWCCPQGIGGVTEGLRYACDLWSEARTLFKRGLKRFCKNVVSTGICRGDERLLFGRTSAADAHWQRVIVECRTHTPPRKLRL